MSEPSTRTGRSRKAAATELPARGTPAEKADATEPVADAAAQMETSVRAAGLLAADRPVVVLYSSGRDSTCLLDLAVRIAGAAAVRALHVNYGLREEADEDERHCETTCRRLGVTLAVSQPRRSPELAGNVQAWARAERYAAAARLADELDARARRAPPAAGRGAGDGAAPCPSADVAAGHTSTDQVETILYRLASSPSRRALLGMSARDGRLIRPLLEFTRVDTAAYCRARGLSWRDDSSNEGDAYARGRVRHELVPALQRIHPAAEANALAVAAILRDEASVLDELVDAALGGRTEIALSALRRLAPALRRLVVQRLADAAVGRPAAGVGRRAEEILALRDEGTAALDLPGGVRATVRDGMLTFGHTPALRPPDHRAGSHATAGNRRAKRAP